MAPRAVHSIRHVEGYHNSEDNENMPGPDLTPKGRKQREPLATIFPFFDRVDLVCASPIRRAIQTALISMEPYLQSGNHRILALPLAQEATDKPTNTPSDVNRLQDEFRDIVDFHRWAPDGESLEAHTLELRKFLRNRDEDEVVVVSHGEFMHYVTGDLNEDGTQAKGWWQNAESRTYHFWPVGDDNALLQEVEASVKVRSASGPSEQMGSSRKHSTKA